MTKKHKWTLKENLDTKVHEVIDQKLSSLPIEVIDIDAERFDINIHYYARLNLCGYILEINLIDILEESETDESETKEAME